MSFLQKLQSRIKKNNSLLCIGLDPTIDKKPFFEFNKAIIDTTADLVCCYKPNSAFYEALGAPGIEQLKLTCDYLIQTYPEIPIILDAKRADIESTNKGYIQYAFDYLQVDAITLHPYLGKEAIQNFLDHKDKGCIILCKTSNKGSDEFQNLSVCHSDPELVEGEESYPFYIEVAKRVSQQWNTNDNCLLVVGATYPEQLKEIRKIVGDMFLLIPGIGAQGGDLKQVLENGLNGDKSGLIISSSRSIIFADSPRKEAEKLKNQINSFRK